MKRESWECDVCHGPINGKGFAVEISTWPLMPPASMSKQHKKAEVCGAECATRIFQEAVEARMRITR